MTRYRISTSTAKRFVFVACLIPLADLLVRTFLGGLGVNPIEYLTHETGVWALRLLLVTLAITPLRRLTGWNPIIRLRRMLGLFAFTYASVHFLIYFVLDQFFSLNAIVEDVVLRPYITVGFYRLRAARAVGCDVDRSDDSASWSAVAAVASARRTSALSAALFITSGWSRRTCVDRSSTERFSPACLAFRVWHSMAPRVRSWRQVARA